MKNTFVLKNRKLTLIILLAFISLTHCKGKETKSPELFVGTYRITDQMVPYPYIIQQKSDSLLLFNNKGLLIDQIKKEEINKRGELIFKTKHFDVLQKTDNDIYVFDLLDTINFKPFSNGTTNPKNAAKFKKLTPSNDSVLKNIQSEITNTIWKYEVVADENSNPNNDLEITQLLNFKNDSLQILTNYYYQGLKTVSEYETKAYTIFKIDDMWFLSYEKGSNNPQPIYQILNYNAQNIILKDFSSRVVKDISFNKTTLSVNDFNTQINNATPFSNCFDGYQGEYYYGEDVTFNQGNTYLVNAIASDAPKNDTTSGYIIIHFTINCKSDVGKFGLIQMNTAFKTTAFSKELVSHILNKVSKLKDWPAINSYSKTIVYQDVHGFLMFKINHGKIVDLCP